LRSWKNSSKMLRRCSGAMPTPVSDDADHGPALAVRAALDPHRAALGELDRVAEQVADHARQLDPVGAHVHRLLGRAYSIASPFSRASGWNRRYSSASSRPARTSLSWISISPESNRATSSTSPSRLTSDIALPCISRASSGTSPPAPGCRGAADQLGEQADRVGGRADVVADGGEEARLAHARLLRLARRRVELALQLLLRRDVHERRHGADHLPLLRAIGEPWTSR
jgi:hypothetical protein